MTIEKLKVPKDINIPNNLTTEEYHELLAFYHFKAEFNPSKVEYKQAYNDVLSMLNN
ncbi:MULTISPECIES: hypothetical protein [Staphylococcus]|uniref:hypothetical protein n=1 Tax=Staphylococcus TaxID=1279 RepID=UPI00025B73FA|nr:MULTISPECIES: hypothetical protein [Staphylococcus]MDU2119641.1 hypothetical protein [Staphylococcus aureus]EID37716.1 hypothetical protein ISK_0312 [Staphylococcus epidermidis IS-K]EJE20573.1 hypothetical protein HMPREF9975_12313 [Staphylococcus epidermidis NIHLM001]MBM6014960.1 hypothetical protein [Staphylococcus epidermidis]MBM6377947.1 hypothetical protein [Staphylococcus epidermidis]